MTRICFVCALSATLLQGQFVPDPKNIPITGKPPVVFLNGYETDCGGSSFQKAFGIADQVLQQNGRASLFFNNCSIAGSPSIEKLGAAFADYLNGLRYQNGQAVASVDVVGYSMGGLILRSYLAGKQDAAMTFAPPAVTHVGKILFIATPNFGTPVAGLAFGANIQTDELSSGSHFLMDLNTWNQGGDDLRGAEAIAIAGTGGTGVATRSGFDDGLVPLSSASLGFYMPGRTRILPLCHVASPGLLTLTGFCPFGADGIAKIKSATDDNARILASFFNGTDDWKTIGTAPEQNSFLAAGGGLWVRARTATDNVIAPDSVRATPANGASKNLNMSNNEIAYTDLIASGNIALNVNAGTNSFNQTVNLPPGGAKAFVLKTGPIIDAVIPAAAQVLPVVVSPRMIVAIYGSSLGGSAVTAGGITASVLYVSDKQINAVLPDSLPLGWTTLTVRNGMGSHSVGIFVEPASPAVFKLDQTLGTAAAVSATSGTVVSPANPLHAGDYLELYLTGLGVTTSRNGFDYAVLQPTVTVGGAACAVTYAGAAPGFAGLDQINCVTPSGLGAQEAPVVVTVAGANGARISPVTRVSVR